jgi:hypothetical protein
MPKRRPLALLLALLASAFALSGCKLQPTADRDADARAAARQRAHARAVRASCASPATYQRLKQVIFDQAIRTPGADAANLDKLSSYSTVRMEGPRVVSRDEALDVTVCGGTLVLQLPPGADRASRDQHALQTDIEYAAQAAADGSGLVYRIKGVDALVAQLAGFELRGQTYRAPAPAEPAATDAGASRAARPAPGPAPRPTRTVSPAPPSTAAAVPIARTLPSFDCRRARTRTEHMVCADDRLAAYDRTMASQFYSALSNGDTATRAELRRTRDRFLAYRERCPDAACVAEAYRDRMDEIRDIAGR